MIALLFAAALAQAPSQAPPAEEPGFVIRTETNLALVRFHVVHKNRYVVRLRPEDIELREDGAPRKVAIFEGPSTGRTVPVEVILLFDVSLSVDNLGLLDGIQETIIKGIGDYAKVSVYAFANRVRRFTGPTRDLPALKAALNAAMRFAHGGTRLYEAITNTAAEVSRNEAAPATRLMIVFSDGFSTSKTKPEVAVKAARANGIALYPVVLGHQRLVDQDQARQAAAQNRQNSGHWGGGGRGGRGQAGMNVGPEVRAMESRTRLMDKEWQMREFSDIGPATGGRSFDPPILNELIVREILRMVVTEVRTEYVAGYYPPAGEKPRPRKVEVVLRNKNLGKIHGGKRDVVH